MDPSLNDGLIARYGPTFAGLVIGTAAKYGMTLTEGHKLTWRGLAADILLLGMLGLIALSSGDVASLFGLHVTGDARILSGALAAVGSDRVVRLVRERYIRKLGDNSELAGVKAHPSLPPDTAAEVTPTPPGKPDVVTIVELPRTPMRRELRLAHKVQRRTPPDMLEQLRKLEDPEA